MCFIYKRHFFTLWKVWFTTCCLPCAHLPHCASSSLQRMTNKGLESCLLPHSSLLALIWIWNVKQNEKNNSILFFLFIGSIQLNQEWEAWMGSVSMLDGSLVINYLLFSYCLLCLGVYPREGLNMHGQFSFHTRILRTLYKA